MMKQELITKKKELPEGWKIALLLDVVDVEKGTEPGSSSYSNTNGTPFLRIGEVSGKSKSVIFTTSEKIKLVNEKDILMTFDGSPGLVCRGLKGAISSGIRKISSNDERVLLNDYLFWILQARIVQKTIGKYTKGAILKHAGSSINHIKIILPPLPIQQKIASNLDKQMAQIEMMKKEAERQDNRSKEALYSFVEEIFQNKYDEIRLDELIDFVKSGISRKFEVTDVGVPVIRSTNIMFKESKINLNDIRYWYWDDPKGEDIKKYLLDQGDILLNFINSPAQIGKACIYESSFKDCIYTTNTFRIKFNQKKILHKFFIIFSLSRYYRRQIEQTTKRAVNQASFTQKDLREIKIPLPSSKIQNKIISRFDEIELKLNELAKNVTKSKDAISQLPSSILNEVFGQYKIPEEA